MSNCPDLLKRQWWLLHSLLARVDCGNERDFTSRELGEEARTDLRTLAAEGCIHVLPGKFRGHVRIAVLKRGELWVERWRKEQVDAYVRVAVPSPEAS